MYYYNFLILHFFKEIEMYQISYQAAGIRVYGSKYDGRLN